MRKQSYTLSVLFVNECTKMFCSDAPVGVKSAWVIPHPVLLNNAIPPMFMSCNTIPTSSTSPTPMFFDQGMLFAFSLNRNYMDNET
uniref:Uncharacterized protein n=1 Tax=Setaria digitata TaxID=48799 RepID=A0A915PGW8_9BILA